MKILKISLFLFCFASFTMSAQNISEHALGLRLGDSDGFGAEISYQKSVARSNRVEIDLGWRDSRDFDAFKLTGVYQWVQKPNLTCRYLLFYWYIIPDPI